LKALSALQYPLIKSRLRHAGAPFAADRAAQGVTAAIGRSLTQALNSDDTDTVFGAELRRDEGI
jgi:hypothetical protein